MLIIGFIFHLSPVFWYCYAAMKSSDDEEIELLSAHGSAVSHSQQMHLKILFSRGGCPQNGNSCPDPCSTGTRGKLFDLLLLLNRKEHFMDPHEGETSLECEKLWCFTLGNKRDLGSNTQLIKGSISGIAGLLCPHNSCFVCSPWM